jgi:hypothetical protein
VEKINHGEAPPTTQSSWDDAEVLLSVSAEEFAVMRQFIRDRRQNRAEAPGTATEEMR